MQGDRCPIFKSFGPQQQFLDEDSAELASRDERIQSIWPFIVRRSKQFYKSLKPRERVNFDAEDIALELWAALAARDHKWEPSKGRYITFAGVVIDRELCGLRDRSRTVESPRNSTGRTREYRDKLAAGTISPRCRKTAADILRTGEGPSSLSNDRGDIGLPSGDPEPLDLVTSGEASSGRLEAIRLAIRKVATPYESAVLGRVIGLWGRPRQTLFWVGWETGRDVSEVRKAKADALRKVREFLISIGHPVARAD